MKKKRIKILSSVILLNLLLMVISLAFHPVSEVGDDDIMTAIVSGCFGKPTPYVFFVNYLWAYFIKSLVILNGSVNWFLVMQYILILLSFITISAILFNIIPGKKVGLVLLLIILPYSFEAYITYTFTKTAGILTAAGFFCLFYYLHQGRRKWSTYLWGMLLIFIGSYYRFAMSFAVGAVFVGSIMYMFFVDWMRSKEKLNLKKIRWKNIIMIAAAFIGIFGFRYIDKEMYNTQEWKEYKDYDYYRGCVRDFPIYDYNGNEEEYAAIGISKTEYDNLLNWNIADPQVYTKEKFQDILNIEIDGKKANESDATIENYLKFITDIFVKNKMFSVFLLLSIFFISYVKDKKLFLLDVAVNFMGVLGVNTFFFLRGRFGQNRVDICIWLAAILMLVFCAEKRKLQKIDKDNPMDIFVKRGTACLTLYILLVFLTGMPLKQHFIQWDTEKENLIACENLLEYVNAEAENVYFMEACAEHYGYGTSWNKPYQQELGDNIIWLGGWYTESPIVKEHWAKNGIQNPFSDMCNMENAYIIDRYHHIDTIVQYLQEHYDVNANVVLEHESGPYRIYKLI